MGNELFSQEARSRGQGVGQVTNQVCKAFLITLVPLVTQVIGPHVFLFFLVMLVVSLCGLLRFLPETRNRTFEEIARELAGGSQKGGAESEQAPMLFSVMKVDGVEAGGQQPEVIQMNEVKQDMTAPRQTEPAVIVDVPVQMPEPVKPSEQAVSSQDIRQE